MSTTVSNTSDGVTLKLTVYKNCDDAQLFWRLANGEDFDTPLDGCLGFMIERQRRLENGQWSKPEILRNRVGFEKQSNVDPNDPKARTRPSNVWPFQRYDWTDHGANNGQEVKYKVTAVGVPRTGQIGEVVLPNLANSAWTAAISIDAKADDTFEAYFNRGFVMSQFVARIARENGWKAADIKANIKELEEPLRLFLSGELRLALLNLIDEAIASPLLELYCALYELTDAELIGRLKKLGSRAHIVLSNGSDKHGDGNAEARDKLKNAKVDVRDRMLGTKGLGHNKFVVSVRKKDGHPNKVWTGSTNWAPTGLCTQVNNGLLIKESDVAQLFLDQWHRLADAGDGFPKDLVEKNAKSPRVVGNTDVWFTRVRNKSTKHTSPGSDVQALIEHVNSAKKMILYVMFQPGAEPLTSILRRLKENIYIRGVVSTVISSNIEKFQLADIDTESQPYETALVQPEGVVQSFSAWVREVTRSEFMFPPQKPPIGHAITHSKMIVIDPLGADCKVITGSHNFSASASEANDENFVVIEGNRALAEAYSVACLGTYAHYSWRAYLKRQFEKGEQPWSYLRDEPKWQSIRLTKPLKEHLRQWCP
jgi:hypothetical protein